MTRMAGIARTVTESEHLRKVAFPAYRAYARAMVFYPGPRVLAVSMPKAGTHLLSSLLTNFPRLMFSGRHYALRYFRTEESLHSGSERVIDWGRLEKALRAVNRGQFMTAHFTPGAELFEILERLGYKTVNIIRDPRDTVVSSTHYLAHLKRHFLHERFVDEFPETDARLMSVIQGLPAKDGRGLPSVGSRLRRYMQWIDGPGVHVCRFEDLVGERGGGSATRQLRAIERIGAHVGRPLDQGQAEDIASRTWSQKSSTFRKGVIGDWRNHFTEEHKLAFKEQAGAELVDLGYEADLDW